MTERQFIKSSLKTLEFMNSKYGIRNNEAIQDAKGNLRSLQKQYVGTSSYAKIKHKLKRISFVQLWRVFLPGVKRAHVETVSVSGPGSMDGLKKLLKKYSKLSKKKNIVPPVIGFVYEYKKVS